MSPPSPPIALPATAARSNPSAFPSQRDRRWPFWPAAPLYPYGTRWTRCQEVIPDQVWTFDQVQGILYVIVPIRMTVVRLAAGGLLVYAPIAPTAECLGQLQALIDRHGPIKYIILPTVSAIEHKVPAGPFAQKFPSAQVYVAPHQWSFPLNLPLSWLGCRAIAPNSCPPTAPIPPSPLTLTTKSLARSTSRLAPSRRRFFSTGPARPCWSPIVSCPFQPSPQR